MLHACLRCVKSYAFLERHRNFHGYSFLLCVCFGDAGICMCVLILRIVDYRGKLLRALPPCPLLAMYNHPNITRLLPLSPTTIHTIIKIFSSPPSFSSSSVY